MAKRVTPKTAETEPVTALTLRTQDLGLIPRDEFRANHLPALKGQLKQLPDEVIIPAFAVAKTAESNAGECMKAVKAEVTARLNALEVEENEYPELIINKDGRYFRAVNEVRSNPSVNQEAAIALLKEKKLTSSIDVGYEFPDVEKLIKFLRAQNRRDLYAQTQSVPLATVKALYEANQLTQEEMEGLIMVKPSDFIKCEEIDEEKAKKYQEAADERAAARAELVES